MSTIAVTGATGHLGRLVVEGLLVRGLPAGDVVAVVRNPAKAADLAAHGVDVRVGDYSDPASLPGALAGVDVLLLISGSGQLLAQHTAVIGAAQRAGVRRIVYTSALRADRTHLALAGEHLATEKLLQESGLEYTILRNGQYIENYTDRMAQFLAQGEIVGATTNRAFAAATRANYAEAAVTTLVQDDHTDAIYQLGGTPFTMTELAAAITDATGSTVTYRDVSSAELLALLQARGVPEFYAGFFVELEESAAIGAQDTDSGDLPRLIGRPSTPLADAVMAAVQERGAGGTTNSRTPAQPSA